MNKIILCLILSLFYVSTANAVSINNFTGTVGTVGRGDGYFNDNLGYFNLTSARNIYVAAEPSAVYIFEPISYALGQSSAAMIADSGTYTIQSAAVSSTGYLFICTNNGIYMKKSRDNTNPYLITEPAYYTKISSDSGVSMKEYEGYMYYLYSGTLKRFSLVDLTVTSIYTGLDAAQGFAVKKEGNVINVYYTKLMHGDYVGTYGYIYKYNGYTTTVLNVSAHSPCVYVVGSHGQDYSSVILTPNYIYALAHGYRYGCSNMNFELPLSTVQNKSVSGGFVASPYTKYSQIEIGAYTTIALATNVNTGYYDTFEWYEKGILQGVSLPTITYTNYVISSDYSSYCNNSKLSVTYAIDFDMSDNSLDNISNYKFKIEVLDANGTNVGTYIIPMTVSGIFDKDASASGTIKINAPSTGWTNGTYEIQLVEYNLKTGNRGVMATTSLTIQNYSCSMSSGSTSESEADYTTEEYQQIAGNTTMSGKIGGLFNSNFFLIMIIIFSCVAIGASVSKDSPTAAIVGFGAGFMICGIMNLLPLWAIFLFAILLFLAFAVTVTNKYIGKGE